MSPGLQPLSESSESLTPLAEGAEALSPLAEGSETLTQQVELLNQPLPGLYPSVRTFLSALGTFPSLGAAGMGLTLAALAEGSEALIPLAED